MTVTLLYLTFFFVLPHSNVELRGNYMLFNNRIKVKLH